MSDWYSFPTYNPYSPSSPYVSNNGMMPSPNDIAAARLRTMGGGGGYRNDPSQFDQGAYSNRVAGLGALGAMAAFPELAGPLAAYGLGSQAIMPAGEADAKTSRADLEALRLKNQNQREQAQEAKDTEARQRQKEEQDRINAQNDAAEATRQLNEWRTQNHDGIVKLHPTWQDAINGATTLDDAKAAYKEGQKQYKEASETLAEKYPTQMAYAELGAGALGMAVPMASRLWRGLGMWNTTRKAENAYNAAFGPDAAQPASQGALNDALLRGNQLEAAVQHNTVPPGASMPGRLWAGFKEHVGHPGELIGGSIAPWTFGNAFPNGYDYMMGSLSSDPGGQEKANKAWEHVWDPHRGAFGATEGLAMSNLGGWLSNGLFPMANQLTRAQGTVNALKTPALQRAMRGNYPAQETPMDLGGWSTPNVTQLYGGPAAAVRRKADRGGYTPVLEGR